MYHRKRQRMLRIAARNRDERLKDLIWGQEELKALSFPKHRPFEAHRRYLYGNLPVQVAPPEHRLPCKNGMKIASFKDLHNLAKILDMSIGEMSREWAGRN